MKFTAAAAAALALAGPSLAAIGDLCKANGVTGTCQTISWCVSRSGSKNVVGACPNDPADVRCCTGPKCSTGGNEFCWLKTEVTCSGGSYVAGRCPGPTNYQCCVNGR